jgi:hypothetical protein
MSSTLWTWERCGERILSLKNRLGFSERICFLQLCIDDDGTVHDRLKKIDFNEPKFIYWILTHYAQAVAVDPSHDLIPYDKLPGGYAFFGAFRQLAIQPLIETFGQKCTLFGKCCQYFGGKKQQYGDCSYEISTLPLIPITIALWERTEEFDARCSVFYDASASQYLPTEDLAHLGELLSHRLIAASEVIS